MSRAVITTGSLILPGKLPAAIIMSWWHRTQNKHCGNIWHWYPMLWCHLPRGGTRSENCWGCAAGHWKLDPKRSREKWYFGAKNIEFCEDLYSKDRFCVDGWEKTPQKDRARSCQSEKRGSKPRHICITHHIGSTPPRGHLAGLSLDILKTECWTQLVCTANIIIKDAIHIFASISKIMRI